MSNKKHLIALSLLFLFLKNSNAQIEMPATEIGFRVVGLNAVDFVFKKERRPDKISRFRLMFSQVGLDPSNTNSVFTINTGFAYGIERRKSLKNNSYFFNGWEPGILINHNTLSGKDFGQITPFIGYMVGFAHNFSEKLCINLEVIPRISATTSYGGKKNNWRVDAGFNSSNIGVGIYYRII
jgi:hypothetical protein